MRLSSFSFFCLFLMISPNLGLSQTITDDYLRSSLCLILSDNPTYPNTEQVIDLWSDYPFPSQYNNHNLENWVLQDFSDFSFSQEEKEDLGFYQDTLKGLKLELSVSELRDVSPTAEGKRRAVKEPSDLELAPLGIDKILDEKHLANDLIKKWFSYDGKAFSYDLIAERGIYNASALDVAKARGSSYDNAILINAGEKLIANTFVAVLDLNFYENEPMARSIRDEMLKEATDPISQAAANKVYNKTKDGWSIISTTRLYRMAWNDSISSTFYTQHYSDPSGIDTIPLFSLDLVNTQVNSSTALLSSKKRPPEDMLKLALYRNIDNAFAKLQKKNDVFKPFTPIEGINPIRAKIGEKEGLKGGEKFEVFKLVQSDDGSLNYEPTGTIKADKIWDNRFNFSEELDPEADNQFSTFKGSKKILPGMVMKLIK